MANQTRSEITEKTVEVSLEASLEHRLQSMGQQVGMDVPDLVALATLRFVEQLEAAGQNTIDAAQEGAGSESQERR